MCCRDTEEIQSAVVNYATPDAANAALLLTNAYIYDKPIQVQPFTPGNHSLALPSHLTHISQILKRI
jgi:hypothetical protein